MREYLDSVFDCSCGKRHEVPVREFLYEADAINKLPELLDDLFGKEAIAKPVIVADARTFEAAGRKAARTLGKASIRDEVITVPDTGESGPVCDEQTVGWLKSKIDESAADMVIAVGSGVINDLCKWSSFELDLPYITIATAASMNGYAAANVAAKIDGVKVIKRAVPPAAVVTEPSIIENAPFEMTASGFGDIIARHQSGTDWYINHLLFGDYYCDFCAGITENLESYYWDAPESIRDRDPEAIKHLFEALFYSGIAMTLVGTSSPASGGEHLFSHTLDMLSDVDGTSHDLHGRQVGLGVIISAAVYRKIVDIETPVFRDNISVPKEADWGRGKLYEAVNRQFAGKQGKLEQVRAKLAAPKQWEQIKKAISERTLCADRVKNKLRSAGAAHRLSDINCSIDRAKQAMLVMHQIRERFTVIDLGWLTGILPDATDEIIRDLLR